ncbi:MAG: arginine 2,3-aminomutase [Isosphaeraceae bacterium]
MTEHKGDRARANSGSGFLRADAFPPELWDDWRWQMQNRIRSLDALRRWIRVTDQEERAIQDLEGFYRWSITPYYASLMDPIDPGCPIRRQAVPSSEERQGWQGADIDPVKDMVYRKTNRVVHKYPDRVVLLVTRNCPVYCRFCTRKYHTTAVSGSYFETGESEDFQPDIDYIAEHPEIRDVLLTGGDPLIYSDAKLEGIIAALRRLPNVEIIRIGTRFPVLLPQRITGSLCSMLERYHPVWLNTHFNHPREITSASAAACDRLLRHGVPVGNQSVLLSGINDDLATMRELLTKLLQIRVRPYYLYHCDNVEGVSHFSTPVEKGRQIMDGLIGYTTGFAVPQYVLTTPLGKIPLSREYIVEDGMGYRLTNYEGRSIHVAPPTKCDEPDDLHALR